MKLLNLFRETKEGFEVKTWKRNLYLCWVGSFLTAAGMNLLIPFLPLYIAELGESQNIEIWSSLAFSSTFLTAAIFSPIWGKLSDRYGRKPMLLRASLGMAIIMIMIGFATSALQLVLLRLLMGAIAGFIPAAVILVASQTPANESGKTLGVLSTGGVAGMLIGPLIGGLLADIVGFRQVFWITGAMLFVTFLISLLIKEEFKGEKVGSEKEKISKKHFLKLTAGIFMTTFLLQTAMMAMQPLLTLYVKELASTSSYIAFLAGIVAAVSGISNILAAPLLGKISDKTSPQMVLQVSLITVAIIIIFHVFVSHVWQLIALRFLLGFGLGGLLPAINTALKKKVPNSVIGMAYGYNQTAQHMGGVVGPLIGGVIAGRFGIASVFIVSSSLLFINAAWVAFSRKRAGNLENEAAA